MVSVFLFQHHSRCTINSCIITQCRQTDQRMISGDRYVLLIVLREHIYSELACLGYASADDENIRVHDQSSLSQGNPQIMACGLSHL